MNEYELYHHGVKGMKWGVRKARKKLGRQISRGWKKTKKVIEDQIEAKKVKKEEVKKASRPVKELSDAELRARVERLGLEQRALDLERQISNLSPKHVSAGQKLVGELGGKLASSLGSAASKVAGEYLEKSLKDSLGLNKKETNPLKDLEDSVKKLELESRQAKAKQQVTIVDDWYSKRSQDTASEAAKEAQRNRAAAYYRRKRQRHNS